jgi:hypothetical protein
VLALLTLSIAVYAAFNLVTGYVYVLGVPTDRLKHNLVAGLSQIAVMAVLLAVASALGAPPLAAAAAIAAARVISLMIGLLYAHHQLRRYLEPAYDLSALLPTIGASAALAAAILLPQLIYPAAAAVPIYALAGGAIFLLILRPAVREEDFALLGELLRGRAKPIESFARRLFGRPAPP